MALSKSDQVVAKHLERKFPRLANSRYKITSPATAAYNCIAWAGGDDRHWWWPLGKYWPGHGPRATTLSAFIMMYASQGYIESKSDAVEDGLEKIALYVGPDQQVRHAARQLGYGIWTSKLGQNVDISHTLEGLTGDEYGTVGALLQRSIKHSAPVSASA